MVSLPVIDNCDDCGACCFSAGIPPFDPEETVSLPPDIMSELVMYQSAGREPGMICAWLNSDRKCSHHKYRPKSCRDFAVGSKMCVSVRQHYGIDH